MGYRYELISAAVSSTLPSGLDIAGDTDCVVAPGEELHYRFEIKNTGYSRVFTPRRAYLRLLQLLNAGDRHTMAIDGDMSDWITADVDVPEDGANDAEADQLDAVADIESIVVTNDQDYINIKIAFFSTGDPPPSPSHLFFLILFSTVRIDYFAKLYYYFLF